MEYAFHLQDPRSPSTLYLGEAIIDALRAANRCEAVFAFASRDGADMLFGDPLVARFLKAHKFSLIVGIDAVTNRRTLERLQELDSIKDFSWGKEDDKSQPSVTQRRFLNGDS